MLDGEVSIQVLQWDNHSFVQFLLPPLDVGPAQLSIPHHLPGQLKEGSAAACKFPHKVSVQRKTPLEEDLFSINLSTFNWPQKEEKKSVF